MDVFQLPAVNRFIREKKFYLFGFIPIWSYEEEHRVYEDPRVPKEPDRCEEILDN